MRINSIFNCLLFTIPLSVGINRGNAQLSISAGTQWRSDNSTQVVLDDLSLQYDGISNSPENIFRFTGTTNALLGAINSPGFYSLQVAKSGVAQLFLLNDIGVRQSIQFQGGLFNINTNHITLAPGALLVNESETSRITATSGTISTSVNLNAPANIDPGNLGAMISTAQNLGTVTIHRGHASQMNSTGGGNSILRYYDIIPANNTGLNATLRFHYFDAELNGLVENGLVLWKSTNNITWTNQGFNSRNTASNYVEKTGITDFSRWTLSSVGNALPVTGLKLTGNWLNNAAVLSWTTIAEYDNDHFDIERMGAGENQFTRIASVSSKYPDGNSQSLTAYGYTDAAANRNLTHIYYRLKQVDKNGRAQYSNIIIVKPDAKKEFILTVYPTLAVTNSLFVQTGNLDIRTMRIQIFDMTGKLLMNRETAYQSQVLSLPMMSRGTYRLVIRSGDRLYTSSFIR
jgi:hypothetical protein